MVSLLVNIVSLPIDYVSRLVDIVSLLVDIVSLRLEMSSVCVLRPVFAFCVLRHVRCKNNVRCHGKHGIY